MRHRGLRGRLDAGHALGVRRSTAPARCDSTRCRRTSRCAPPARPTATPNSRCCCAGAPRPTCSTTLDNTRSEHRSFALTAARALEVCADVARAVNGWRAHFEKLGVTGRDLALLSEQIDRMFLRDQRERFK